MQYQAIMEKSQGWWIGWLVDLPGVNAQERTREELLESLKIGAEDMLDLKGIPDPNVEILVSRDTRPHIPPGKRQKPSNQAPEDLIGTKD